MASEVHNVDELTDLNPRTLVLLASLGLELSKAMQRVDRKRFHCVRLGEAHWTILGGLALALSGTTGPVEVFTALGQYAMTLPGIHLGRGRQESLFQRLRSALKSGITEELAALVVRVDESLRLPDGHQVQTPREGLS